MEISEAPEANVQHTATLEFLAESPSPAGKSVLDVGCGDGFACVAFKTLGAKGVVGNDIFGNWPILIKEAGLAYHGGVRREGLGLFDIVWCHHVLEHQERPIDFLKSIRNSVKPDGELWITVPNMKENINLSSGHLMAYNMPLLIEHLRQGYFDVYNGAYRQERGHLRARVRYLRGFFVGDYPVPMARELRESGRCNHESIEIWNWPIEESELPD